MSKFHFRIDPLSSQLKFQQLIDSVIDAISRNLLEIGDILPSVNQLCHESSLSRDTVFKAYAELKNRGIVESVPNKGYFVARAITKVFLFLDTFKAYKEVLYGSLRDNLPDNIAVDLNFHHYNIDIFEKVIKESLGKYNRYIVMNFDHVRVPEIVSQIPRNKLLVIDWMIHSTPDMSVIFQDFGKTLYDSLNGHLDLIKKYERFIYLYPEFTYHPPESIIWFEKFTKDHRLNYQILRQSKKLDVQNGDLYLLVSDRTLARFLDQCSEKKLIPGKDVGVISYNETPMKKYVKNGITVISTDFELMGRKAAEFAIAGEPVRIQIPTQMKVRSSL
ncbi:MAG: GntR family transcriptional regulator [Prolixibacteraceae bacterium]